MRILIGRHPLLVDAMTLARHWCTGHEVAGQPALAHASQVALTVAHHCPDVAPEPLAAALLHDAHDFAPRHLDVGRVLSEHLSAEVARIVGALVAEHPFDVAKVPDLVADGPVLLVSAADKAISIPAALARPDGPRPAFAPALAYLDAFTAAATPLLPTGLACDLAAVIQRARQRLGRVADPAGTGPDPAPPLTGSGGGPPNG